jgi:hypothetical protein
VTTRGELLEHLSTLARAGHVAPCLTWPEAGWTSDDPAMQRLAASLCGPCAALTACGEYGTANPLEYGVYGARTDSERHRTTNQKETTK